MRCTGMITLANDPLLNLLLAAGDGLKRAENLSGSELFAAFGSRFCLGYLNSGLGA